MNQIAKKSLIEKYPHDSRLKEIDRIFESQYPACLRAIAVFGAQECFIVRGLYERKKRPFLIVAENKETAAYFWNTLWLRSNEGGYRPHFHNQTQMPLFY